MPSGDVHTAVNLGALAGTILGMTLVQVPSGVIGLFSAGFLIRTLLITPDLDLAGHVRVRARCNWGIWGELWRPLSLLVKHRGVTHTFVRGPLLLLAYAVAILALLTMLGLETARALHVTLPADAALNIKPTDLLLVLSGYFPAYWLHV